MRAPLVSPAARSVAGDVITNVLDELRRVARDDSPVISRAFQPVR